MDWETQLYGGEYYEDKRVGTYSIASKSFLNNSITGEILYERYSDYNFAGVGGHFIWEATTFAKFGLVGSHSHEEYNFGSDFEDQESEVVSNTLGLGAELNHDPVTLAVQLGRIFNNTYNNDRYYLSMDIYYWGAEYQWYARGATRQTKNYKENTMPIRLTQGGPLGRHRRFWPMVAFGSVLKTATRVEAPTYRDLYESARARPNPASYE